MQIDKLLKQCDSVASDLWKLEDSLTSTMKGLGLIANNQDWESFKGPKVEKYSAGVVIVDPSSIDNPESVEQIRVGIQMAKIDQTFYGQKGSYIRLAIPGGAIRSNEELVGLKDGTIPNTPEEIQKGFYHVAQKQLLESGDMNMTYDLEHGAKDFLSSETFTRIVLEMGEAAASNLEFIDVLPHSKTSVLPKMTLPDKEKARQIANNLCARGVKLIGESTLELVGTRVNEKAIVATTQLGPLIDNGANTQAQRGMRIYSLAEVIRIGLSSATEKGYTTYRKIYPNDGHDGLRNPSAAWLLGQFVYWIRNKISAADTYKDNSPRQELVKS